jgi:nitrite reductase (cytochrome c-552)
MAEPATSTPETPPTATPSRRRRIVYAGLIAGTAVATLLAMLLWQNILERKEEARHSYFKVVELTEETVDPSEWGKNFPRQFESYRRTVDTERTRHGGSDAYQKLDDDSRWRILFQGYSFAADYREERGHAYMLSDQDMTERVKHFKQPAACLHCHSSVIPAYREAGRKAGAKESDQIMKGFELVCALPYGEGRKLVSHPVSCLDCHDPKSLQLRVTRPGFLNGLKVLSESKAELPHFPSIERWRKERRSEYDPNTMASRQELRSMVCTQCHVEYHFKGPGSLLTYPWHKGLKAEEIEQHYDETGWKDWTHPRSGAPLLKAQHPEFELWSQGIHARSGVACADCHMPYKREGAVKISDHHVRSPLLNVARSCQTCHRYPEQEILARVTGIQDRTKALMNRAENAVLDLITGIERAKGAGIADEPLSTARQMHRKAQWRLDFVAAENSMGFHAPGEAARLLAEAIDYARQGQASLAK